MGGWRPDEYATKSVIKCHFNKHRMIVSHVTHILRALLHVLHQLFIKTVIKKCSFLSQVELQ